MDTPIYKKIEDAIFIPKKRNSNLFGIFVVFLFIAGIFGAALLFLSDEQAPESVNNTENSNSTTNSTTINSSLSEEETSNLPFTVKSAQEIDNKDILLNTSSGMIRIKLYSETPITSSNFINLVDKKFYDGQIFHRVINGFMIQGGDPTGTGTGGAGYTFKDELFPNTQSYIGGYKRGTVAMANAGPNTNSSQFFIMHQNYQLPHDYTIFGEVIEGIEVVDKIAAVQVNAEDKPLQQVKINSIR